MLSTALNAQPGQSIYVEIRVVQEALSTRQQPRAHTVHCLLLQTPYQQQRIRWIQKFTKLQMFEVLS